MLRLRPLAVFVSIVVALCLLGLWGVRSQTSSLRRVTVTTEEGININPSLSGDGRRIAFESTEDLAHAGGSDRFRAIRADLASEPAGFIQMAATRGPAPGISQDGSRIAFAAKEDPLGTNQDGNSEIFLFDGTTLRQVTNTTPNDISTRNRDGNFQPSLTDDGRFIAFSSNRNLAAQNSDGNLEIFVLDTNSNSFAQLTNTTGAVGASDAKISGDGTRVAYVRDGNALPAVQRDLVLQDRTGGTTRLLATGVTNLAMTYGRAISDDGLRVVYSGDIATDSSQVFLFDGRTTNATRQITVLGVRTTEVPLHPTISGDGTRIAFATRRPIPSAGSNSDNSIELYTYDIPTGQFARVTTAPSTADGFSGSTRLMEVVSSLNDDGSTVAFNFPRVLSGAVTSGFENNSEIYVTGTTPRPTVGSLTIFNEASFGHEPSTTKAISPDGRAVALGGALSFRELQAERGADGNFPTTLDGTTVTVNGRRAQIFYVSPTQVNFYVPPETELGTADVIVTNGEGFQSRGTVSVLRAAPGIFTKSGDGVGEAVVLNANMQGSGTFDPSDGQLRLIIFTTGVLHASQISVTAGGRALTFEAVMRTPGMPGMDEVRVLVPADLRGAGTVNLVVRADGRDSNPATIIFAGNSCRDIVINEVLADPPDGLPGGDANRDGARDSSDDEFVELVNTTANNIDISGYELLTRSTSAASDTSRHTFPAGTLFPARSAIVIFGGGGPNFNPNNPAFGGAQVFKASSGGLSLTNAGGVVTLREPSQAIVNIFSYGGSTGLSGDANQSLTRSPDAEPNVCGSFTLHSTAPGGNGQPYSPGTRIDGSPFAPGVGSLTSVTISPPSSSVAVGQTTQFTAQAHDQFGRPMTNVTITFASDNTSVATVDGVTTNPSTGIATATVTGRAQGTAHITASATDGTTTVNSSQATLTVSASGPTYTVTGQVLDSGNNPLSGVLLTFDMNFQGTLSTKTSQTDANGNYSSGDLGCQNSVKVTPSKAGLTFTPSAITFVNSSQCLTGSNVANFTGAPPPPGTLVISQIYVGGGLTSATYRNDFVEVFNSGSTTVDFSATPYSIQFVGTGSSFGSTSASNKTNITSGIIAPGQYFLVQEASGGAVGATLPAADASGSINLLSASGKIALVVGTTALPASACPGDDGTSPFIPSNPAIADFVGYGGNATTAGHCYEGPAPAAAPTNTTADFRKGGGCVDTNFNADDFLLAAPSPRNTSSPLNDCSAGPRPDISINDPAAVSESTANATFTVTLSAASTSTVTVDYATANGTATAGADYQLTSGTLTFAPSETTKSIVVPIISDTLDEPNETFFVNLSNAPNAVILDGQGQGTITDDDAAPTISIDDVSVAEGDSGTVSANFNVSLSAASGQQVTVAYATADGSATAGSDYQAASGTVTFNPGQTTQTITVLVNGETTFEANENFFVNLSAPSNATILDNQGQGTITNDDAAPPVPAITIDNVSVAEGDSGTKTLNFTVSLSMSPTTPVTVDYATADGTATAGSDYQSTSGTLTFNLGETGKPVAVTINGDTLVESDETFFVNLSNASANAILTDNQGQGTIQNDDTANLVITQIYGGGNNSGATFQNDFVEIFNRGTTTVNFALTPYSVQYASAAGTFSAGNSIDLTSGSLLPGQYFLIKLAGGTTNGAVLPAADATNTAINMSATDGKVALVVGTAVLSGSGCPIGSTVADFLGYGSANCSETAGTAALSAIKSARRTVSCTDTNNNSADFTVVTNPPAPRNTSSPLQNCTFPDLTINDVAVTEGNAGPVTASFTVTLSAPAPAGGVTFDISTQDNTATVADSDYVTRTLTGQSIAAGLTTYTFDVTVNGDTNIEAGETFFVNVTNVTGANVADSQGVGTIQNDDSPPDLTINDVTLNEGNTGTTTFTFTVSLSSPALAGGVSFDIATQDNTATVANNDFVNRSLTSQTIPVGQQTYTFDVTVNGDTVFESNESFFVNVTNVTGSVTVVDAQGVGTITNDDAQPTISIADTSLSEGNAGTSLMTFTVTLSNASQSTITVNYDTADSSATVANNDYASASNTLTFDPGDLSKTFTVTINGDTNAEGDENFLVNLSAPAGATIADSQALGTIFLDDPFSIAAVNTAYTENFDVLAQTTSSTTPTAWTRAETGSAANTTYSAGTGSSTTGDTYSFGSAASLDRALGGLRTGSLIPTIGAFYRNDTGTTITSLNISYTGEEWRLGAAARTDRLDFQYSTDATSLTTGTWTDVNLLDFTTPNTSTTGLKDGNNATNRTAISQAISSLSIAPGATFWIRWTDVDASGADDGLAVDDFTLTANLSIPALSIDDVSLAEGDSGTKLFTFTVSLSQPAGAGGVTFDIATQDNTATDADDDYETRSLTTQTISAGNSTYTFDVTVNGDTAVESNETFFVNVTSVSGATVSDAQGVGTIQNDDAATPALSITDVTQAEGNAGPTTFTFTVNLSSAAPAGGVTFDIATADDTAQDDNPAAEDNDYVARSLTSQTIPAGQQMYTFDVTVNGDTAVEPTETFFVNVTGVTNATVSDSQAVATITNDDAVAATADLSVTKTDSPDPVAIGNDITYTITVTNAGPDAAASAALSDTVPTDTTFRSITTPSGWTCGTVPAVGGTGAIGCTNPSFSVGSSIFTLVVRVNTSVTDGTVISNTASASSSTFDPNGLNNSATQTTTAKTPLLVISQVYGGGGNGSATYTHDFIEIFNRGTTTVDFSVTPYSVQYASATGAFSTNKTDITSGIIAPGKYFLVQEASGGAVGSALPTPDATGTIAMSATAGKVALVLGTALVTAATCPGDDGVPPFNPNAPSIVDFLGYGSTANCYEGSGPPSVSGTNSNARSIIRTVSCTDTNVNSADFSNPTTPPTARNSATAAAPCP